MERRVIATKLLNSTSEQLYTFTGLRSIQMRARINERFISIHAAKISIAP